MDETSNKFSLPRYKFMPEMYLRQPVFAYCACRPFTKNKEIIQKFKEAKDSWQIYQNEVDKAYF